MTTIDETDPRLTTSHVLVVGVGGLGAPAAMALGAAGVGTLVLIDPDRVEVSNLHRQPLYEIDDVGRPKVEVASARLRQLHSRLRVVTRQERFSSDHLGRTDVVLDGTDSIAAKFAVNDACVA